VMNIYLSDRIAKRAITQKRVAKQLEKFLKAFEIRIMFKGETRKAIFTNQYWSPAIISTDGDFRVFVDQTMIRKG
jgi:hypothetical protein